MPEIVIIGAGISGLGVAKKLVGRGHNVTVINSTPYFEWPIAGSYSLTHPEELPKAVTEKGHWVKGAKMVVGTAVGIADGKVQLQDGQALPYDVLVVATGFNCKYFKAGVGQSYAARKDEVQRLGQAVRSAKTVLIGGGGTIAVEFAGDVREVNPTARIVVVSRSSKALPYLNEKYSQKLARVLAEQRIEVLGEDSIDEKEAVLQSKTYTLRSGKQIEADVYVPAFSSGMCGGFTGLANERGEILVNDFLQAQANPKVFAVGCSNIEFSAVAKIMGQIETVSANVLAHLANKPLKQHKENLPTATHAITQKIGHYTYAWIEYEMLPAPVRLLAKGCGFPCWGSCCCWLPALCCSPCHPFACGVCCGEPEGKGTMTFLRMLLHSGGSTGIKLGGPEPSLAGPPAQQEM